MLDVGLVRDERGKRQHKQEAAENGFIEDRQAAA